ncbi:hypothetical protein DFH07DRAFT_815901 [Mycena maculata]|uniref:Uncharacterized protein n=1 Tax=Mycena maculata TaxID=230809 RepID=A0AAD7NHE4_9AGAR|nr:hypothetical protein DFH07DRAFT_815901 [Mycena maculata]
MHQIIMLITELVVSVIMILRIYSLYGRSARVLWSLLGIGVCFIGLTIWSVQQGQHGFPLTVFSGCHLAIVESASYHLAAPWGCLFVFDSIIFGMTVYNAYVTRRGLGDMPIHRLLLRDGSMYFAATALANLSNIVTFLVGGPLLPGSLATFATCMSVTMVSRLMLNLHAQTDYGILTEGEMHLTRELEFTAGGDAAQPHTNNDRDPDTVPILPLTRDEI